MIELLGYPFMQRALLAALLTGLIAPAIGTYIVQRRLSLLGDGLGHVAIAGVGLALLTGQAPLPILSRAFDDAFMLMAGMTVVGILLSLFLRDRVLEDLRNKPKEAEAGALQLEPAD